MAKSQPTKKKTPVKKKAAAKKVATKTTAVKKKVVKKTGTGKAAAAKAPAAGAVKKEAAPAKTKAGGRPGKAAAERGINADARPSGQNERITPAPPAPARHSGTMAAVNGQRPTDAELRKVKTGLSKKDLATFRGLLLTQRAELIGDVQGLEASRSNASGDLSHMPLHMADVGSDSFEQEFTLGLMESERRTLIEIDEALQRIGDGTYGVCLESAQPIARARLEAKPWAKYTIEVAREHERRGGGR